MTLTAEDVRTVTLCIHTASGETFTEYVPGLNAKRRVEWLVSHGLWHHLEKDSVFHAVTHVEADKNLDELMRKWAND
jgi:hypothetical protein